MDFWEPSNSFLLVCQSGSYRPEGHALPRLYRSNLLERSIVKSLLLLLCSASPIVTIMRPLLAL